MKIKKILNHFIPNVGKGNLRTREDWLLSTLKKVPEGSKILDAGAGTQRYRKFCKHLVYVSQDFAEYNGKGNTLGLQTEEFNYGKLDIISDITAIPEANASFDAIMCIEVLEHVSDPIKVIKEFARLLKSKGHLILTAPFCSLTHYAPHHFSTGFNIYWYKKHLAENGFMEIQIVPNGNYFEYVAQEIYRIDSVSERYTKIKPNLFEFLCIYFVQKMLFRFSQKGRSSSELLCFGYQIYARKS